MVDWTEISLQTKYGKWGLTLLLVVIPDSGFSPKGDRESDEDDLPDTCYTFGRRLQTSESIIQYYGELCKTIRDITTKDFAKYDEIIKIGEKEAKNIYLNL